MEPIGNRIITLPQDAGQARNRDPRSGFIAYVPVGSLAAGKALVENGGNGKTIACTTCHAESGRRIRLQGLPQLSSAPEARKVVGEWPAYRVSTTHVMTMQHRLLDCYWQMRLPPLELGSEASVALIAYLTKTADGGEISAPGLKR